MKKWLVLVLLAGMAGWAVWDQAYPRQEEPAPATPNTKIGTSIGEAAPNFALQTLDGQQVKLSDYRGKKVFLNFWASWCGPCKAEMPEMQKFYEETKGQDLVLLALNATSSEKSIDNVRAYIEENGYTFPVPLDEEGRTSASYRTVSIPTSYFLDAQGIVRAKHVGPMTVEDMREYAGLLK